MLKDEGKLMKRLARMKGRSLLTLHDLSDDEMLGLLDFSDALKRRRLARTPGHLLDGKQIAMIFEKLSTRTRCATSTAVFDEGGRTEYLGKGETHLGKKESIKDSARVLGRMFDGIMFRGFSQSTVECLARYSGIPVWNGLTDQDHPTQTLADLMTVREAFGKLKGIKVVYVGDGRNNVACSLMVGCAKAGVDFVNCTPEALVPSRESVVLAREIAAKNGGSITVIPDPGQAVRGANAVYTDVWVSMGEESQQEERLRLLRPYQITADLMAATGNVQSGKVIFLHCLPAFHDSETEFTKQIGALEVTNEVFEAPYSRVFDQAENRVHTIKAVIVSAICGPVNLGG